MSEKEKFNELCAYVKGNILHYDETKKIPRHLVLRLRGLHYGQFIANSKIKSDTKYDYDVILTTFKYCAYDIKKYINANGNKINGETHLINLIMTFVEKEINNVVERLKQKETSKQQLENIDNSQITAPSSDYVPKTDKKKFRRDLD